ncbi:MAG: hypothetical protein IJI10_13140 [Eubacterium sp.]|nr:hypothetical protein [Eubacterium sp.]
MINSALCEIIDRLIYDSGMTETEAICLVGRMLQEEIPGCIEVLESEKSFDLGNCFQA